MIAIEVKEQPNSLTGLGQRLRRARKERRMSQEVVAAPYFTKSYISALEREKVRPSLKALQHIANRLDIPVHELLVPPAVDGAVPLETLAAAFDDQLDQAEWLISASQAGKALAILDQAADNYRARIDEFDPQAKYRLRLLHAAAYMRAGDLSSARNTLDEALGLAELLPNAAEEVARLRAMQGGIYAAQDMPHQALQQHELCLRAVQDGAVRDLNLKLTIYDHLAADYQALGEHERTAAVFKEMLALTHDSADLSWQADAAWELSRTYIGGANDKLGRQYSARAITTQQSAANLRVTAAASIGLAVLAMEKHEHDTAAKLLHSAAQVLAPAADKTLQSTVYERLATLELERGNLAQAEEYARQSVTLGAAAYDGRADLDAEAQSQVLNSYALALRTMALIANAQGQADEPDNLLTDAMAILRDTRHGGTLSQIEYAYAEILRLRGNHEAAGEHYRRAYEHRQQR